MRTQYHVTIEWGCGHERHWGRKNGYVQHILSESLKELIKYFKCRLLYIQEPECDVGTCVLSLHTSNHLALGIGVGHQAQLCTLWILENTFE